MIASSSPAPDTRSGRQRWWVLMGLMLVYATTNGIVVHTLPLLYPAIGDEFGWTTAQITLPATVFFVFGAVTSPPAGYLLDRFSPSAIMGVGLLGMLISLLAYAGVRELWQLVAVYLVFGLSLSLCGLTASMVILTRWFSHHRGKATGLLLMASSAGGALFPQVLGLGMASSDWRTAVLWIAGVGALLVVPAMVGLVRDVQNLSAKDPAPAQTRSPTPGITSPAPTLAQALRSPTFYLIVVATTALWFSIVGLIQHQSIYLARDVGVPRQLLPHMFSLFFGCSVLGKLGFGWLADHLHKEAALLLSILTFLAGLVTLRNVGTESTTVLFAYAAITGIGFSGTFTMIQLLIAQHFSGPSYGKILALLVMLDSLAGGAGTRVLATLRDSSGSYVGAINLMTTVCLVAACCVALVWYAGSRPTTYSDIKEPS